MGRLSGFRDRLYLTLNGFNVRYEYSVDSRTPDWCILDETSKLSGIVELTNFHTKQNIESEMKQAFKHKGLWVGWMPQNDNRLYKSISHKAGVYKDLVGRRRIPYVIALYGDFFAAVDVDELHLCLADGETSLFELYPTISGVVFFEEKGGKYHFKYFPNSHADTELQLAECIFP
jgi:hypothetical protein